MDFFLHHMSEEKFSAELLSSSYRELHHREITALTRSTQEICADQKPQSKAMRMQRL